MYNMPQPPLTPNRAPDVASAVPTHVAGGVPAELQKPRMTGAPHGQHRYQGHVPFARNALHASPMPVPSPMPSQNPSHYAMGYQPATQPDAWMLNQNAASTSPRNNLAAYPIAPAPARYNHAPAPVAPAAGVAAIGLRQYGSVVTARSHTAPITPSTQHPAPIAPSALPWQSQLQPLHPVPAPIEPNEASSKFISELVAGAMSHGEAEVPKPAPEEPIPNVKDSPFINVEVVPKVPAQPQAPSTDIAPPATKHFVPVEDELPSNLVEQPESTPLASGNSATTVATETAPSVIEPMIQEENIAPEKPEIAPAGDVASSTLEKPANALAIELDYPRIVDGKLPAGVSLEARSAMLKADAEDELQCFMATTKNAVRLRQDGKKILFEVSLQEFPRNCDLDLLKRYYYGKAYRRACVEVANKEYDFKQHLPFIVEHRGSSKFLFCELTRKTLPLDCQVIENHVNSKKYLRLKEEAETRINERKRVLEKKRKIAVGERNAKVEARRKDATEDAMLIAGYDSADDSDFDVDVEQKKEAEAEGEVEPDDDDVDSDVDVDVVDPLQQDILKGNMQPVQPEQASPVPAVGKTGPERQSKTRAADMKHGVSDIPGYESEEDSDFDPTEADDGDVEMGSDADEIVDPIVKDAAAAEKAARRKEKAALQRRSKAAPVVEKKATEAPQFNNTIEPSERKLTYTKEDTKVHTTKNKSVGGTRKEEMKTRKQNAELKEGEYYVYKTVQKTAPPRPVDGHLAEVREKLRKKRDKKKALRKAMKKVSHERKLIAQAKRELILEQEKQEELGFWTRGKFDVDDEVVRAKAFAKDPADAEWATRQPPLLAGSKRKREPAAAAPSSHRTAKKSRQERMRRLMPGANIFKPVADE